MLVPACGLAGALVATAAARRSAPLDAAGNSVRAMNAITDISNALAANPYLSQPR